MNSPVKNTASRLWVLAALVLLTGCPAVQETTEETELEPVTVQVAKAELITLRPELELVGTLTAIPERTAMVSSQLGGWVKKLAVVEGAPVKANQLLVQLDDRAARTDVDRALAIVAEKESALKRLKRGYLPQEIQTARKDRDKAQATVDGLQNELAALKELLARREISPVTYETKAKALAAAQAALASAEAHYKLFQEGTAQELIDEAQALLDVAKADLDRVRLAFEWCSIASPIDGIVVQLQARQGQFFDRAVPLATIVDMSELFVQLRIPTRSFDKVHVDTPVTVQVDALPGREFAGRVARISGQADSLTGNVVVYALVENKDLVLRPGLSCRARISLPEIPETLAVPVAAVSDNSGTAVVTAIRDDKAYETEVQTGTETSDFVQILSGLAPGDVVAIAGGYGLPAGCPVHVAAKSAPLPAASDPHHDE